jgi:hypothetical protein
MTNTFVSTLKTLLFTDRQMLLHVINTKFVSCPYNKLPDCQFLFDGGKQ